MGKDEAKVLPTTPSCRPILKIDFEKLDKKKNKLKIIHYGLLCCDKVGIFRASHGEPFCCALQELNLVISDNS